MQELRREKIKRLLSERESVEISMLVSVLGVSEMTIHRDLDMLQREGYLKKLRGGAVLNESGAHHKSADYHYSRVQNLFIEEKMAIAREALHLISDRETIVFDNSTTAYQLARLLGQRNQLTVIATNPGVFNELVHESNLSLYCTGGLYSSQTNSFVGSAAEDFVTRLNITTCVIGANSVSLERGVTDPYPAEASLKRKIIAASRRKLLLADHNKFLRATTEKVADIEDFDCIITDWRTDVALVEKLSEKTRVIVGSKVED